MTLLLLVPAALILLVLRGAGGALVKRCGGEGGDHGLGLAAGFGIATLGVFGLALARQVGPWALGGFVALLALPAWRFFAACPEARRAPWPLPSGRAERLAWGISLLILGLGLIQALAPPTGLDSGVYHMLAPKMILQAGGLDPGGEHWFHRTGGFYFIHLLGMGLGGEILAKLLAFGALLAVADLAWTLCERLQTGAGPLGTAATCASPLVSSLAGHEYLEIPILMYVLAALVAGRCLSGSGGAFLAGALLGSAVGMKSTAFPALVLSAGLAGFGAVGLRRYSRAGTLWLAAGFVVPAAAWSAWNWASTGSPLYSDYAGAVGEPVAADRTLLFGRALVASFLPSLHYWGESAGPWPALALLGWLVLGGPREARPWGLLLLSGMAFYFIVVVAVMPGYLAVHSHGRYLAPLQLAVGVPLAVLLVREGGRPTRVLLLAALLVPSFVLAAVKVPRSLVALPVALGLESRQAYLSKKIETFDAGERLRGQAGVRVLFLALRSYYLDVPWVWADAVRGASDRDGLIRRVRELGITHVIVEPSNFVPPWLQDPGAWGQAPFRVLERWPSGVLLVKVE